MYTKPLLSLCMIVKNEAKNICRCLESVSKIVDEIVIVDTGSEDDTVEHAKFYGASIYYLPWRNDFSEARNYALRQTTGQWILVLDADEYLDNADPDTIKALLSTSKDEGYYIPIYNYKRKDQGDYLRTYGLRLFRNHPLYCYEGKVHEQILPGIKRVHPYAQIGWSSLIIHHYGYVKDSAKITDKALRNLAIMSSQHDIPFKDLAFVNFNMAMEMIRLGELSKAEERLKQGWAHANINDSFAHCLLIKLIACLHWQGKNQEALRYCEQGLTLYSDFPDIYYYSGICLAKIGELAGAKNLLLKGLAQGDVPKNYISQSGCGSFLNLSALGRIEEQEGNDMLALDYYLRALHVCPDPHPYLKRLIVVLLKSNLDPLKYLTEKKLLTDHYQFTIVQTIFNTGLYGLVLDTLERLKDCDQEWELQLIKGKSLMRMQQFSEALNVFKQIPTEDPIYKECLLYCWMCEVLLSRYQFAKKYSDNLIANNLKLSHMLDYLLYVFENDLKHINLEDYHLYQNNECIISVLTIIDSFAACKSNQFLSIMLGFIQYLAGYDFHPLILRFLYRHHCYTEALQILEKTNRDFLSVDDRKIVAHLDRWSKEDGV